MDISIIQAASGIAFAANPLWVYVQHNGNEPTLVEVKHNSAVLSRMYLSITASINIADAAAAIAEPIRATGVYKDSVDGDPTPFLTAFAPPSISVSINGKEAGPVLVLPGGITKRDMRNMPDYDDTDIFTERFLNDKANRFFTERISGRTIHVRETELEPLLFCCKGRETISCMDSVMGDSLSWTIEAGGEYQFLFFDIRRARRMFLQEIGSVPSVLKIRFNNSSHFLYIAIEETKVAPERNIIKYRNSLGAFELFDCAGEAKINIEAQEQAYNIYDGITDDYTTLASRAVAQTSVYVDTGIIEPRHVRALYDLLGSDEVYLFDNVRVRPSLADAAELPLVASEPFSTSVKFTIADSDGLNALLINLDKHKTEYRIFAPQFNNIFN